MGRWTRPLSQSLTTGRRSRTVLRRTCQFGLYQGTLCNRLRSSSRITVRAPHQCSVMIEESLVHAGPQASPDLVETAQRPVALPAGPTPRASLRGAAAEALLSEVRAIAGVKSARIRNTPGGDRSLRVDISDDADPVVVAAEVRRVVDEQSPTDIAGSAQVVLHRLVVMTDELQATASVSLRIPGDGTIVTGTAIGPSVDTAILRSVAIAAVDALNQHFSGTARGGFDHGVVTEVGPDLVACAVVTVVSKKAPDGHVVAERLVGAALVHGDPRQAMVRAVLSAVEKSLAEQD